MSGVLSASKRSGAFNSSGLNPRMPSRMRAAFIRLMILVRSPTRFSRSRLGRFASSSSRVGIATLVEDDVGLHVAGPQPSRQPEAVPTGLEGQNQPRRLAASACSRHFPSNGNSAPGSGSNFFRAAVRSRAQPRPPTSSIGSSQGRLPTCCLVRRVRGNGSDHPFGPWGRLHLLSCRRRCQRPRSSP